MSLHSLQSKTHRLENWSFGNATTRLANGAYQNVDIGKLAYQQDEGSYWRLIQVTNPGNAATPTWGAVAGSPTDKKRILVLDNITALTGGGANNLDGLNTAQYSYGQKVCITIADSDSFFTYQNGVADPILGDVATPNGKRWRKTGGY